MSASGTFDMGHVVGVLAGYRMTIAGHTMDIIAVDGQNVKKTRASSIVFYIGSRYDVILCADQVRNEVSLQPGHGSKALELETAA